MKKIIALLLLASMLIFTLSGCSGYTVVFADAVPTSLLTSSSEENSDVAVNTEQALEAASSPTSAGATVSADYDSDDLDTSLSSDHMTTITLAGDAITVDGNGATVEGNIVTIMSAGMYSISGALNDGQIIVNTEDEEKVRLVLNGADIACSTSAPIYVVNAEKTVITLAEGTANYVSDGAAYVFEDADSDAPNAAIFSHDDLTINGYGSLTVNANYKHGIVSNDDLKITGGSITVNAVADGIKGQDSLLVREGIVTINAGSDGMQANNDEDAEKGYVLIEGGTFNVTAGKDGIQAETSLLVSGGELTIASGGGSANGRARDTGDDWGMPNNAGDSNAIDTESTKGMKAGVDLSITGGTVTIDAADDALHSNDSLTISGGNIVLASGDDGMHSDTTLAINGGDIRITQSYEGLESATITINDGAIHLVSSDDGINAVSADADAAMGRPGPWGFESGDNQLYVNGGYVAIDAGGDGLDINGPINMTGGGVLIDGPTSNNNGALDYTGAFEITGGFLVAVGSAGMAQAPSASSTQYSVMVTLPSAQAAGTMLHIESEEGEEILSFVPAKAYQSVVISSPELENGATYVVYTGGSSTGKGADGLYSGGTYTPGTQVFSLKISGMVTGAGGGGFGGPGGDRQRPGGGRMRP